VAVFRTFSFQPLPLIAHKIPKTTGFLVKSVPQEPEVNARQAFELVLRHPIRRFLQLQGQDVSARVVIRAVAFSKVRYAEDRVLENAGAIGHSKQVV
jgi:hypothetical protein